MPPTLPTIDVDLNLIPLSWTIGYALGTALFIFATRRSLTRLQAAEDQLSPESVLCVARMLVNLCGALALLGSLHTLVGVLAIIRHPEAAATILVIGAVIFGVAGFLEVSGMNHLMIAIRREVNEGLWARLGPILKRTTE